MNRAKVSNAILSVLVILMGVMLLVSLGFSLLQLDYSTGYGNNVDKLINNHFKDTGFSFLSFKSNLPYVNEYLSVIPIICGIFSIIQLLFSFALILVGICSLSIFNEKLQEVASSLMKVGISFSAFYMLEGFIYEAMHYDLLRNYIENYNNTDDSFYNIFSNLNESIYNIFNNFTTLGWLAFLCCGIVFIAYILCKILLKSDDSELETEDNSNIQRDIKCKAIIAESEKIEILKKYKALFDEGIITQEEFDSKRKDIL